MRAYDRAPATSSSNGTDSFAVCATVSDPGPQITVGMRAWLM